MLDVEAGGQRYQEMHVDGGTMGQAFVYPATLPLEELALEEGIDRERKLYIIRNSQFKQDWANVERREPGQLDCVPFQRLCESRGP